ncbi:MAG: ATP-dependent RNA helicase HrpA [Xanthomonadaceae bacterium]|nr:ATP-dependent RNA helicase HrpA [Xanthomonadaceae bacterium]
MPVAELDRLEPLIDLCPLQLRPLLRKRWQGLRRRARAAQPVDRGLRALARDLETATTRRAARLAALPSPEYALALPVVARRAELRAAIAAHPVIIVCGETGSGKTTQLPKICLELGRGVDGLIGHTQPRRIAARSLAARVAEELHSRVGQAVGCKMRFHDQVGEQTFLKIMTDGILLAETQGDPDLLQYDTFIIDEAHERSLNVDFLLGYLKQLLPRRPDLKLIITSATIDPERFSRHFSNAPVIEVSGRTYPVELRYRPLRGDDEEDQDRDRGQALLDAVDELAREGDGDVLVFLSGERDIREAAELLRKHHPPHTEVLPLYARLSASQQQAVFRPHRGRRIVLATNVAETSLTVPGIRYVVDTGLARLSRYSYRSKVQRLPIEKISRAAADQRAGRCGRVAAGICIRLYSEEDFAARPAFTEPEILRTNLAAVILQMSALGLGAVEDFPFVEAPDARFVRDGFKLLQELGAVDEGQRLTERGRQLARLPVDPRIGRMILAAREELCLREVLVIAAALSVQDPRERPLDKAQAADEKHRLFAVPYSDFLGYLNLWNAYHEQARHLSQNKLRKWCQQHFISYVRMREWHEVERQLQRLVTDMGLRLNQEEAEPDAIHRALLSGLLGNIAMKTAEREYTGARNLKLELFPGSVLVKKRPQWIMAAELVETGKRYARTLAVVEPRWVEPLAAGLVKRSHGEPHWEKRAGQVVARERVTLYGLPVVTQRRVNYGPIDPVLSRELFIREALVAGQLGTPGRFMTHNRALVAEVLELEARARRRDLLVSEEELYAFYDARLPAGIHDQVAFEHWRKQAEREDPRCLYFAREALLAQEEAIDTRQFPAQLEWQGLRLPVRYRFEPGEEDDGMTVTVPLAALNQLRPASFEWLVPGLLEEKLTLLIKSLPKQQRRHFVPVPEFAGQSLGAQRPE